MSRISAFVFASALIALTALPASAQVATGVPPFGSFNRDDPDTVNLGNLNVHITIPVLHKAGRGTNFTYDLSYDSSIWYPAGATGYQTWVQIANNLGWRGQTEVITGYFSYGFSYQIICGGNGIVYRYSGWVYHEPNGTPHSFVGTSTQQISGPCGNSTTSFTSTANDGSGYTLTASGGSGTVTSPSGMVIQAPTGPNYGAGLITDRNGNQISVNGSGTNGHVYGSLIGKTVTMTSVTNLHYDEALGAGGLINNYKIVSWFEDNR